MKKKASEKDIAYIAAEHQASLMRLAATWAAELSGDADSTNTELLGSLSQLLEDYRIADYSAEAQRQYLMMNAKILEIRAKSFAAMADYMARQCEKLAENEANWAAAIAKRSGATGLKKTIRVSTIVKYAAVEDGQTISESIAAAAAEDAKRISEVCREGVRKNKSLNAIVKDIRGTKESDYKDGVFEATRSEAETIARTGCMGIADEAKMQFYIENQDVIIGIMHVATLSGNTCLVCGNLDGHIWKNPDQLALVPNLPIHPNCRCVHLPVTEMHEINRSKRPAEEENYWKEAEKRYNEDHPGKRFNDLARSTKLKYYYQAQKDYEARTGKPAFEEVPQNMSFAEWLKTKDDAYIESYLGKTRYALYTKGELPLNRFINPATNVQFTIEELKALDIEAFRRAGLA
jgi:SPP1 gp7 family putative phage head morphogenesis protein